MFKLFGRTKCSPSILKKRGEFKLNIDKSTFNFFQQNFENKEELFQEFLSFIYSEIVLYDCPPAMILEEYHSEKWDDGEINELGFGFINYLLQKKSSYFSNFAETLSFYKLLSMELARYLSRVTKKDNSKLLVPFREVGGINEKNITVNQNYRQVSYSVLEQLNDADKKVLCKYFFIQERLSLKQAVEVTGLSILEVKKSVEKISDLLKNNFSPKKIEEVIEFFGVLTSLPEIEKDMMVLKDNIFFHPTLIFLEKIASCPDFDLLKKYHFKSLSDLTMMFLDGHISDCENCQTRIRSFSRKLTVNLDYLSKIDFLISPIKNVSPKQNSEPAPWQIWSTLGYNKLLDDKVYKSFFPCCVLVVTQPEAKLDGELVIKVRPISVFTEFRSQNDVYIEDEDMLGQPFIVENWNELPMMVSGLGNCICYLEENIFKANLLNDNSKEMAPNLISQFQYWETNNNWYLSYPVMDLLYRNEKKLNNRDL